MRKVKKEHRAVPYLCGTLFGYIMTLGLSVPTALLLSLTGYAEVKAGASAVIIMAVSVFFAGRFSGKLRSRDGLRTGFFCGVLYLMPLLLIGVFCGTAFSVMFFVKIPLCLAFSTAGGVFGVNSQD